MTTTKQKEPSNSTFERLAKAVAAYVAGYGGKTATIGGMRVVKRDKHRFTLEVDFTGSMTK
jgi:hypothetical protein